VNPPLYEKNTESNNPPVILFMSRIEPKKGLNLLIPALERVLAAGHRFQFVLAGSNPQDPAYEAQIQTQIQQSSLAEYTTITGFVTGEEKARLLQTADLFVLPSYYENFGIAVAEAMVAGIPVVISDGVQIWEQVKQAEAGWVSQCEELEIATLIGSALQNQQERQRRGRNAKQFALQQYSWDAIAQQTIVAYQQILDGRQVS
jgi:glycosyltransferase involved in cell wall biosynthesis